MSKERFLQYICYSTIRPDGVSPPRWAAMLKHARVVMGINI